MGRKLPALIGFGVFAWMLAGCVSGGNGALPQAVVESGNESERLAEMAGKLDMAMDQVRRELVLQGDGRT